MRKYYKSGEEKEKERTRNPGLSDLEREKLTNTLRDFYKLLVIDASAPFDVT